MPSHNTTARTVLVSSLLVSLLTAPTARADLGKWGKGAAVAGGAIAAYGAYKLYKNGKRIQQLEAQQEQDREQREREREAEARRNAAPAPIAFQERLVLGDGSGQRAIYEVAPGSCAFKVKRYDAWNRLVWQTAFDTPCSSTFAAPQVSPPTFDASTESCTRSATYSTSGGNGSWTQSESVPFSSCGFSGVLKTYYDPGKDGTCETYGFELSKTNPAWIRITTAKSVAPSLCGFKLVRTTHRVINRKEGELYPKCIRISEYSTRKPLIMGGVSDETFSYRTEADELDLRQCGIKTFAEMSWQELAKSASNLAKLSLWKEASDQSAAKNIAADEAASAPTSPEGSTQAAQ